MLHNLRTAIAERFGSQLACAEAARIHPVKLNRFVNGWAQPTAEEKERLCVTLDAEVGWLFARVRVVPRPVPVVSAEVVTA